MTRNTLVLKRGEIESDEEDNERKDCASEEHQWDPHGHDGLLESQNVKRHRSTHGTRSQLTGHVACPLLGTRFSKR